jgi:hypothetical protein
MEKNCEIKPKPGSIKTFFKSRLFWKPFLGAIIGSTVGFMYYYFIGCTSGHCAITSNPYMSILWGGLLGVFIVSSPCNRGRC